MKNNKNNSKEEQKSKPKMTRSSKQKAGIWLGAGAAIVTIGGAVIKLLTGGKGNDGGKQA